MTSPKIFLRLKSRHNCLELIPSYLVAVVLLLVPFHAFLTVWASTTVGHYTLLRLWPEMVILVLALWILVSGGVLSIWREMRVSKLAWWIAAYLGLNAIYFIIAIAFGHQGMKAASYGLLLNTRPVVWFVLSYAVVSQNAWLKTHWSRLIAIPVAIVSLFALLQFFVFPPDWLHHFGYIKDVTIAPIETINQDTSTVRAQSFLRGPNPLGAYLVFGLTVGLLYIKKWWQRSVFLGLGLLALLLSFSRSAWLGLCAVGIVWLMLSLSRKQIFRVVGLALVIFMFIAYLVSVEVRHNGGLQNALFHVNNRSTAATTSNEGRRTALTSGARDVVRDPLGRGLGTAGPASVYSDTKVMRNSENFFLGLGQEIGWLGLLLFVGLNIQIGRLLYAQRTSMSKVLLATLFGLSLINLLSYGWSDVTLAYLWWGSAGICLAASSSSHKRTKA